MMASTFIHFSDMSDECKSNPCNRHGKCVDKVKSFICNCEEGWTSQHCEEGRSLLKIKCLNKLKKK